MNNFYKYRFIYNKKSDTGEFFKQSVTVIFCPGEDIQIQNLQLEIKLFYEEHHHTDDIVVIGGDNIRKELQKTFIDQQDDVFKYLHKVNEDYVNDHLYIYTFDKDGLLSLINKKDGLDSIALQLLINEGLQNIFLCRGGLVESKGAHHFVFPSGKHCNKFLRTGNILLHSSEIYFIAFTLLKHLKEDKHNQIYCDTSSINTIAFALLDLKRKLIGSQDFKLIPIQSFSSYEGLQESKGGYFAKSLILISASTSGNILDKIKKANPIAKKENMLILYFHGKHDAFIENQDHILCNLTKNITNPNGIEFYKTFDAKDCEHCLSGSYPVNVVGDVFLLEKPKINSITLGVKDAPKALSNFVKEFRTQDACSIFKACYKEIVTEADVKYDIYFDMFKVLSNLEKNSSKEFTKKLYHFIDQFIPSNTKYLICLTDEGSKLLADIILDRIKANYVNPPIKISRDELYKIDKNETGAAVVVASCISNGKNLLYISRSLRDNENLRLIYFNALTRTKNEEQLDFLKSNLKQGHYGNETNTFVNVYNFYMNNASTNTTWISEIEYLQKVKSFYDDNDLNLPLAFSFIKERIAHIQESINDVNKGLSNQLFYRHLTNDNELSLRKNFAFFNFKYNDNEVSQADVYFTISTIINTLRNSKDLARCLIQTEFVRNIIEPGNFNRFNDGIIQASLLRAASKQELAYHLDYDLSKNMYDILTSMIKDYDSQQGEALLEFVYAIASKKLSLRQEHLADLCNQIKEEINVEIFQLFIKYIEMQNVVKVA